MDGASQYRFSGMHAALVECQISTVQSLFDLVDGPQAEVKTNINELGIRLTTPLFMFIAAVKKFQRDRPAATAGAAAEQEGDICPITQLPFEHKVQAKDGIYYERSAILRWCVVLSRPLLFACSYGIDRS